MFYLGEWIIPQLIGGGMASEDIGFFPFPYDNEKGSRNVVLTPASGAYGVNKNSDHPAAAKAFVKWMIEESGADAEMLPILKDGKAQIAQMEQFDSYKPAYLEGKVDTAESLEIVNKAQIVKEAVVQDFVLADRPQETFDKYNKAWAKARAEVMK
jgi:ABC-type glycerol-3-phosphate transport system substrate-binding protein